ncbi:hypothetical protein C8J56DRAFT_1052307 [Mycena floridula]|nr:hypothetical protein C8J56DRAFT_1052307 [Mycena floridula]
MVPKLPVFYLEGRASRPAGFRTDIARIYAETANEVPPEGDPIPPRDVLLLTPRDEESSLQKFWCEVNKACRPFQQFNRADGSVPLPRVVIRFPFDPELFLDEDIGVEFSVRSFDPRYNIFTVAPNKIEIFDRDDDEVLVYVPTSAGYMEIVDY